MEIRLAHSLQRDSIVDGEGIRTVIWTQGCPHNCLGCHNPHTHSFDGGFCVDVETIKKELAQCKGQDGITLSGGDPFMQPEACYEIVSYAKEIGLNVWCYTGYTYEVLQIMSRKKEVYLKLLENIDVLVDGKFMIEFKSFNCKFRGSSNQRVIDVKKSLEEKKVVLIDKYHQEDIGQDLYKKPKYMFV